METMTERDVALRFEQEDYATIREYRGVVDASTLEEYAENFFGAYSVDYPNLNWEEVARIVQEENPPVEEDPLPREDPPARDNPPPRDSTPPSVPERDETLEPGTYVSSWYGQFAIARMLALAVGYGFQGSDQEDGRLLEIAVETADSLSWPEDMTPDEHDWIVELGNSAEQWLNEHIVPEGLVFGWWEGEFTLMRTCENDDPCEDPTHDAGDWHVCELLA